MLFDTVVLCKLFHSLYCVDSVWLIYYLLEKHGKRHTHTQWNSITGLSEVKQYKTKIHTSTESMSQRYRFQWNEYHYSMCFWAWNIFEMGMIVLFYFVVFTFMHCECGISNEYKSVETYDGIVRGQLKQTLIRNVSYYAFLGIPYAEKPINELRFKVRIFRYHILWIFIHLFAIIHEKEGKKKIIAFVQAPEAIASCNPHIFDAFEYGNSCIQQSNALGNAGPESEDCLYLNIFVPGIFILNIWCNPIEISNIFFSKCEFYWKDGCNVFHTWRWIFGRIWQQLFLWCRLFNWTRHYFGDNQLSIGSVRIYVVKFGALFRKYGFKRSAHGIKMDASKYSSIWRRSTSNHIDGTKCRYALKHLNFPMNSLLERKY